MVGVGCGVVMGCGVVVVSEVDEECVLAACVLAVCALAACAPVACVLVECALAAYALPWQQKDLICLKLLKIVFQ